MTVVTIPLSDISVANRLRNTDDNWAQVIAQSIEKIGLVNPLTVRKTTDGRYALVAGAHRYRGLQITGATDAPCIVREMTDEKARLAEIDENIMRRELSKLSRAEFLAERRDVYHALFPETAHGKAPKSGKDANIASFAEDAAEKTGLSKRTIQDAVALVAALDQKTRDAIRNTELADNAAQLKAITKLAPDQRHTCAKRIADGDFTSVKDWRAAVGDLPEKPEPSNPRDAWMVKMLKVWGEGKKKWREDLSIPAQKGSVFRCKIGQFDWELAAPWRVCLSYS